MQASPASRHQPRLLDNSVPISHFRRQRARPLQPQHHLKPMVQALSRPVLGLKRSSTRRLQQYHHFKRPLQVLRRRRRRILPRLQHRCNRSCQVQIPRRQPIRWLRHSPRRQLRVPKCSITTHRPQARRCQAHQFRLQRDINRLLRVPRHRPPPKLRSKHSKLY